jgi:SAM-dependent methyltransferase
MPSARSSLSISVRRHFVDDFFISHAELFKDVAILDIGGKKKSKRGIFDIDSYSKNVTYINIDTSTEPDIIADAAHIPLPDSSFDAAIMGEVLEHVEEPIALLKEAHRLLKPGRKLIATVPFLFPIHADPHDFGRYTEYYWREASKKTGFSDIEVEKQGTLFAVLGLALQHLFKAKGVSWRPVQIPLVNFLMWLDRRTTSKTLTAWTTGYGIVFTK